MYSAHTIFTVLLSNFILFYASLSFCDQGWLQNDGLTKCCGSNEQAVRNTNGTVSCVHLREYHRYGHREYQSILSEDFDTSGISTSDTRGIPDCFYRILTNEKYTWFNTSFNKVEVGIIYLLYPVWMQISTQYCIDVFHEGAITELNHPFENHILQDNDNVYNESVRHGLKHSTRNTTFLAFCSLDERQDYYMKTGLSLFFLLLSACFNLGTISIYTIARKVHGSREWMQFSIFIAEFLGNVSYSALIISQSYYFLWSDSLQFVTYCYFVCFYMYTAKFALVIATSIDLLWCVWRPFSANDEAKRSKRNNIAVALCYIFPILIPATTTVYDLIVPYEKQRMNSNERLLDGAPKYYKEFTKVVFIVELGANILFAIFTTLLIKRQRRKTITIDEKRAEKNIQKSFGLYMRLIFAQEMPFSINFVLLLWVGSASPLSIWWNLTRGTYLISAIYSFIYFGCNKKHLEYMKRLYTTAIASNSGYY